MEVNLTVSKDEAPATHGHRFSPYHWRAGSTGYAECNTGHGDPRLVQEWLTTGWRNEVLHSHPFYPLNVEQKGDGVTPEYLEKLADVVDPDKLWKLPALDYLGMPTEKRQQLDAGVALRRYAQHLAELQKALVEGKSILITPLSGSSTAVKIVDVPPDHLKLLRQGQGTT